MYVLSPGAAGRCLFVGIYGTCKAMEIYKGSNITLSSGTDTLTVTFSDSRQYGFTFISLQGDLINDIYLT